MSSVALKLYQTDPRTGKTSTTTISDANPEATNEVLLAFSQKLHSLTSLTYEKTEKVVTTHLDTESEG